MMICPRCQSNLAVNIQGSTNASKPPDDHSGAASPPDFDLRVLFGYAVARLSASAAALAEAEAQAVAGLTLPEYRLLATLTARGAMGVVELQHATRIDKAWVSRTLARLVERGLVSTSSVKHDARRVVYAVTEDGDRIGGDLIRRALRRQQDYFNGFEPAEVAQLRALIERVQANIDRISTS